MNIEFYAGNKNLLVYKKELHNDIVEYINTHKTKSILFCYDSLLKKDKSISYFNEIGLNFDIENQIFNMPNDIKVQDLYQFKNLNSLTLDVNMPKEDVDLSNFPLLTFFSCEWNNKIKGLDTLTHLRYFSYLSGYKPKSRDLSELSSLEGLEYLKLLGGNFTSLRGLNELNNLKTLRIYSNKNLLIDGEIALESVKELHIDGCKQVGVDFYKSFPNVEILHFDKNADVLSLKPVLDGLTHLKEISVYGANILEEDNSYWLNYKNIKEFNFRDRRYHKLKAKEFGNFFYR